jgi:hypothetical protein
MTVTSNSAAGAGTAGGAGGAGAAGGAGGAGAAGRKPVGPARAVALAVGALLTLGLVGYGCFVLTTLISRESRTYDATYPAAAVRSVAVDVDDAGVTIVGGLPAGQRVTVHSTAHFSWEHPAYSAALDGHGTLRVRLRCSHWSPIGCSGRITLAVPSGVPVAARSNGGGVLAERLDGPLTLSAVDGGVHVADVSGDLRLTTSDGGIHGDGIRSARVTAKSSDGGVHLTFAVPPRSVTARSSDGGTAIHLPAGSGPYNVQARASDGSKHTNVRTDPRSDRTITVTTSDGGASVDYDRE